MHRSVTLTLLVLAGCGSEAPAATYPVTFESVSDPGVPLAGVTVVAGGEPAGVTDSEGRLSLELGGREGSMLSIAATCPAGYRAAAAIAPIVLRRTIDLSTGAPSVIRVTVTCPPELRHGVVVLRAGGEGVREGIPVVVDGVEMARTDRSGVAHVALSRPPGTTVSVMLATSTVLPDVTPRNPTMPFTFRDADDIFFFDRPLEAPAPTPVVRRGGGHRHTTEETITRGGPCNLRTGVGCH